jgi:hypothetical protein
VGGADMATNKIESVKPKCAMMGCNRQVNRALAIALGTVVDLCTEHYAEEKNNLDIKKPA